MKTVILLLSTSIIILLGMILLWLYDRNLFFALMIPVAFVSAVTLEYIDKKGNTDD